MGYIRKYDGKILKFTNFNQDTGEYICVHSKGRGYKNSYEVINEADVWKEAKTIEELIQLNDTIKYENGTTSMVNTLDLDCPLLKLNNAAIAIMHFEDGDFHKIAERVNGSSKWKECD